MRVRQFEREQVVRRPLGEVFEFFAQAGNLELITPPWLGFRVLTDEPVVMAAGALIDYRLRLHGLPLRWTLGDALGAPIVHRELVRIFDYRRAAVACLLG